MEPNENNVPQSAYVGGGHRKLKVFLAILVVLLIGGGLVTGIILTHKTAADQDSEATAPSAQITITADTVTPSTIQVKKGQSVVWINADQTPHTLTTDGDVSSENATAFDGSEQLDEGESYSYVFNQAGTYSYFDATNPGRLQGVIIVK
jgi:plastocyanin